MIDMAKKQRKFKSGKSANKVLAILVVCSIVVSLAGLLVSLVGYQVPQTGPVSNGKVNVYVAKEPSKDAAHVTVNVVGRPR
jgi:hypothetical protein